MAKKRKRTRILNLGCNQRPIPSDKRREFVNVDVDDYGLGDKIVKADLNEAPWPFQDASFDHVQAADLVEHLESPIRTMNEIWRVLKPGGTAQILVPSTEGLGAFQDPTHIHNEQTGKKGSYWNENSFGYYAMVPENPADPKSPLKSHPWRTLYPQMIKAAFITDLKKSAADSGIIYIEARLTKVDPECPTPPPIPSSTS